MQAEQHSIRSLGEPAISSDPAAQAQWEQLVVDWPVTYQFVIRIAHLVPTVGVARVLCELAAYGYDRELILEAAQVLHTTPLSGFVDATRPEK